MAHSTVRQWETVAELIGRLDGSASPDARRDLVEQLFPLLDALKAPAPLTVWEQLLQEKVPLRLMQACAQHMQSLQAATAFAARAAATFWGAAFQSGVVPARKGGQPETGSSNNSSGDAQATTCSVSSSTTSANSSNLSAALLQQLQQSGLLQLLPAMLSAASQQLQRAVAAAEAGGVEEDRPKAMLLQELLMQLLSLAYKLLVLPRERNNGVGFVPLPAVAGLLLSSLRYLRTIDAAQPAAQQPPQQQQQGAWKPQTPAQSKLVFVMSQARHAVLRSLVTEVNAFKDRRLRQVNRYSSSSSSGTAVGQAPADAAAEQVLCSEECMLCLAVLTIGLVLPYTATPPQEQVEGGSGSGSSGSNSGGSSGSGSSSGGNASRQAGTQPQDQGPGDLPPQLMAVLQQAGCSADPVFACKPSDAASVNPFKGVERLLEFVGCTFAQAQTMVCAPLQGQQLRRMAALHRLMCSALLQLAHMFVRPSVPHMDACSKCCVAALLLLQHVQHLEQLQQARGSSSDSSRNPSNSSGMLVQVLDLLGTLLQLWSSTAAALTAADAPMGLRLPESSSSSGGSTAAEQASVPAALQGADGPVVLRCISRSINVLSAALLPLLCDRHLAEGPAQGGSAGGQREQSLTAVRLCSLLSQQTRVSIEAVQLSGSSSAVTLRQSGQVLAIVLQAAAADLLHALQRIAASPELRLEISSISDVSAPGGADERQLLDFMFNLAKFCSIDSTIVQQQPGCGVAGIFRLIYGVASLAANSVGMQAAFQGRAAAAQAAAAPAGARTDPQTAAAAAAVPLAEQYRVVAALCSSTCHASPLVCVLPWLVLLGRCCLLWSQWLQHLSAMPLTESWSASDQELVHYWVSQMVQETWDVTAAAAPADPGCVLPGQHFEGHAPDGELHNVWAKHGGTVGLSVSIQNTAAAVSAWLATGSNMQQLADLGYNGLQPLQAALVQLHADAGAIETALHHMDTQCGQIDTDDESVQATCRAERASVIGLYPQLQVVGEALTAFAIKLACNNPGCVNASGPSEARLVRGNKSSVCGGCLTARYCSRACTKQHWKVHKPVCKALAAARAAAAADAHASG